MAYATVCDDVYKARRQRIDILKSFASPRYIDFLERTIEIRKLWWKIDPEYIHGIWQLEYYTNMRRKKLYELGCPEGVIVRNSFINEEGRYPVKVWTVKEIDQWLERIEHEIKDSVK